MTVKEAVKVLKSAKKIVIGWDGGTIPLNTNDALQMDAFGNYVVDNIVAVLEDCYELDIAVRPVKDGE